MPVNSRGQRVATNKKTQKQRDQAKAIRSTPRYSTSSGTASVGGGT